MFYRNYFHGGQPARGQSTASVSKDSDKIIQFVIYLARKGHDDDSYDDDDNDDHI